MQVQNIQSTNFKGIPTAMTVTNHLKGGIDSKIKIVQDSEDKRILEMEINFLKGDSFLGGYSVASTGKNGVAKECVEEFFKRIANAKVEGAEWLAAFAKTLIRK